jgi:hypothetical protein
LSAGGRRADDRVVATTRRRERTCFALRCRRPRSGGTRCARGETQVRAERRCETCIHAAEISAPAGLASGDSMRHCTAGARRCGRDVRPPAERESAHAPRSQLGAGQRSSQGHSAALREAGAARRSR